MNDEKDKIIKSSIYSFKKAINEYNNLFEPERVNQFFSNIFQAFHKLFIFYCLENKKEYKNNKNKIKKFNQLEKFLKTNNLLTSEESYILNFSRDIRNQFQHNVNDNKETINNSFLLISCVVSIFKKLLKIISKSNELKSINLVGISSYKFIENNSVLSKKLKLFYFSNQFKNYEYSLPLNTKTKGTIDKYFLVENINDKAYYKAKELVSNIKNKYPQFTMEIFWKMKNVFGIVNKIFKSPSYSEIPKLKNLVNQKYILIFKNTLSYKKDFKFLIMNILDKNNINDVKKFFDKKNEEKEIVDLDKLTNYDYKLNLKL